MLWYGYLYYILFNLILLTFIFSLLRLYLSTYVNHWFSIFILNRVFLSIVLFFFFISFTLLNYTIEISELIYFSNYNFSNSPNTNMTTNDLSYTVNYITNLNSSRLWSVNSNSLNMLQTYTYPFIYVFFSRNRTIDCLLPFLQRRWPCQFYVLLPVNFTSRLCSIFYWLNNFIFFILRVFIGTFFFYIVQICKNSALRRSCLFNVFLDTIWGFIFTICSFIRIFYFPNLTIFKIIPYLLQYFRN